MKYSNRTYRRSMEKNKRFNTFTSKYYETDLMIGVSRGSFSREMAAEADRMVVKLRNELQGYIAQNNDFLRSLIPVPAKFPSPDIVREMCRAAARAGTGPMASVAGAIAERVGRDLKRKFGINEIWVENGGDIFAEISDPIMVEIFAGESPISGRVGFEIGPGRWGICTSSATVGPSLNFGTTDATMIITSNSALADALATKYGNMVQEESDLKKVIDLAAADGDVASAAIVRGDKIAVCGMHKAVAL